jgi:peptide-methionine (R)-S-oxide reductase
MALFAPGSLALGGCFAAALFAPCSDPEPGPAETESPAAHRASDKDSDTAQEKRPGRAEGEPEHPERWANPPIGDTLELPRKQWKARLTERELHILREEGTEPAFSGAYHDHHEEGIYRCAGCGAPLYSSEHKFDSGTGWPSFYRPVAEGRITKKRDGSLGMVRTEVECARCGGHLGHVFDDGPPPTGKRHCINSLALDFDPAEPASSRADGSKTETAPAAEAVPSTETEVDGARPPESAPR